MANSVNYVWNYCNDVAYRAFKQNFRFVSGFDLINLTSGSGSLLNLSARSVCFIAQEFAAKRKQFKKVKLKWRSSKRNLGWIPFDKQNLFIKDDSFVFMKRSFKVWKSREIQGNFLCGSFNQDSLGNWYVNITTDYQDKIISKNQSDIGIDLGLKTKLTLSDGVKYNRENLTKFFETKLAMAQRAKKKRLVKKIHAKIANKRKDFNHKVSKQIVKAYKDIYVGDVSSSQLAKTKMAKSVNDAGWFQLKTFLKYKALNAGNVMIETKERLSTITCSSCHEKTGPSGLSDLDIREWACSNCHVKHDRDVNAAINILRFGYESRDPKKAKTHLSESGCQKDYKEEKT